MILNPNHRLSHAQIRMIFTLKGSSERVAGVVGVSNPVVCYVRRLKTKAAQRVHDMMVDEEFKPHLTHTPPRKRNRFTAAQVAEIRASSVSSTHLAAALGCSASLIRMIRTRRAYK